MVVRQVPRRLPPGPGGRLRAILSATRTRTARGLVAALILLAAAPAAASVPRALGLDPREPLAFGETPGLLAGDLVATAGRTDVLGWPVAGGPARRLGRLPDLGPTGRGAHAKTRINASEPGRVALTRNSYAERTGLQIDGQHGPQLAVGPPEGPFAKVRGCGETAGWPASLDRGRVAYRARPGGCVDTAAVVVRDAGGALERIVALPAGERSVRAVALRGDYLAYEGGTGAFDFGKRTIVVVDLRTGARVTALPPSQYGWTLGDGGVVYAMLLPPVTGARVPCAPGDVRRYAVGDATGVPVPEARACSLGLLDEEGGLLRFTVLLRGGRFAVRAVDPLTGSGRTLAVTARYVLAGDAAHLVADDADCRSRAARIVELGPAPVRPAGPRRCPVRVRVPARVRLGGRIGVRLRCRLGCLVKVSDTRYLNRVARRVGGSRVLRVRRDARVRLPVPAGVVRRGRVPVRVRVYDPIGTRRFTYAVRVATRR